MTGSVSRFLGGAAVGFLLALGLLMLNAGESLVEPFDWAQWLADVWKTARANLQGSIELFALVMAVYVFLSIRLWRLLKRAEPRLDSVVRLEQLLDLCASLFFGIGVIWTAIGMRGALLFALGDPGAATQSGAMAVLQRLVDGGILLALSTTIVGGAGGYLMRAVKYLLFGRQLTGLYMLNTQRPLEQNLAALRRIEERLVPSGGTCTPDEGAA